MKWFNRMGFIGKFYVVVAGIMAVQQFMSQGKRGGITGKKAMNIVTASATWPLLIVGQKPITLGDK